jgi:DNA relaxase NicK
MSGQGCRVFETLSSNPDFNRLFQLHLDGDIKITRLDVAYDDFKGVLNLDKMVKEYYAGHFISQFGCAMHTHELTNCRPCPVDKGHSLAFGSSTSNVYFRVYDKRLERERSDVNHWIRFEMQLRREAAGEFVKNYFILDCNIGDTFLSVVNNYLRFCKPSKDTNISRWQVAPWWLRFVNDVGKTSLYSKKTIDYNMSGVLNYVVGQAGNSLDVVYQTIGFEALLDLILSRDSKLTPRQRHLIEEFQQQQFIDGEGVEF